MDNSKFPSDVLKWMKSNAKPKMALKLMQVCKYFQHSKFPYFFIEYLRGDDQEWTYKRFRAPKDDYEKIDLESLPNKLWITRYLELSITTDLYPFLMPKIEVCDVETMTLKDQNIKFADFKTLTGGGKVVFFIMKKTFINYDNGSVVPLENIFDCLPKVSLFNICYAGNSFVSAEIATKKVPHTLTQLQLSNVGQDFNIDEFFKFALSNQKVRCNINLDYTPPVEKIKAFTDEVIKIEVCDVQKMYFIDQQIIFDQFKILTCGGNVRTLSLNKTFINYESGEPVPLENIFESLPNVKRIFISYTSNSFVSAKIGITKVSSKLKEFRLSQIRRDFNIDELLKFVLSNQQIHFVIDLGYSLSAEMTIAFGYKVKRI